MNRYDAGDLVRLSVAFADNGGVARDPGAVTVDLRKPDGSTSAPSVTKDSTGNYHVDVDTTSGPGGIWLYRFTGTAPLQAVADGQFYVATFDY